MFATPGTLTGTGRSEPAQQGEPAATPGAELHAGYPQSKPSSAGSRSCATARAGMSRAELTRAAASLSPNGAQVVHTANKQFLHPVAT